MFINNSNSIPFIKKNKLTLFTTEHFSDYNGSFKIIYKFY